MLKAMKKIVFLCTIFISFFLSMFSGVVFADYSSVSIANTYLIADKNADFGDIIINSPKGLVRSTSSYQNSILGVLTENPVAVFRAESDVEKAVATGGVVEVNVVNQTGAIKKGDFVTSSDTPGKGMKATNSGYILGMAVEDATGGSVNVAVRVEYAEIAAPQSFKRIFDLIGRGLFQNVSDPDRFGQLIRYIAAGLAVLIAFALAFLTFAKTIPKSIEAIGRNPLARNSIYLSLAFAALLIVITVALGIGAAIVILRI